MPRAVHVTNPVNVMDVVDARIAGKNLALVAVVIVILLTVAKIVTAMDVIVETVTVTVTAICASDL